jgi:GNAT superfamily N-acetyltransferase
MNCRSGDKSRIACDPRTNEIMKIRWTPERIIRAQARSAWQEELRANRVHFKDESGVHLDKGGWGDQLRYHDSEGVLRGVLRLHHERPNGTEEAKHDWDDYNHEPEFLWIAVDPNCLRRGIATTLLDEAFRRGWPIDFDKQEYSLAGSQLRFAYLRRLEQAKKNRPHIKYYA